MGHLVKALLKKLLRSLLGEYSAYYIYATLAEATAPVRPETNRPFRVGTVDASAITSSPDPLIREQAGYGGPGSHAYACFEADRIVGICFYWFGDRYRTRNYWPLVEGEAKLVQIVSIPEMRGRGVATQLIAMSSQDMMQKGFSRAYARIWHSNIPSLRAFERARWTRIALVIEVNPLRRKQPIRIRLNSKLAARE